jgi:glycine dehydrogenase subunit 1
MHRYNGNTPQEQSAMLAALGREKIEELFSSVPPQMVLQRQLDLPSPLAEQELKNYLLDLADKNYNLQQYACFLGAGAYDRYIPSLIHHLTSRQEFLTSYTPYQPEISQGTLQAIFEYQTMICQLTGMEVSNASMYDGASALAEAVICAASAQRRQTVLLSAALHPQYRRTVRTYCRFNGLKIQEIPHDNGITDMAAVQAALNNDVAAVVIGQPNFFGLVEDVASVAEAAHAAKALLLVSADPIALAILEAPGKQGADFVVGEGQPLGNPLGFGGPYLGFFATTQKYLRRMPGRIAGMTKDKEGQRGFVLTIQTREQHIRREKATSNICSNQALCALTAAIYLATLGKEGLKKVAQLSMAKAHYAYEQLLNSGRFQPLFADRPFVFEFAVHTDQNIKALNWRLLQHKIIGGYNLAVDYPQLAGGWLLACTEKRSKQEIDLLVEKAGELG